MPLRRLFAPLCSVDAKASEADGKEEAVAAQSESADASAPAGDSVSTDTAAEARSRPLPARSRQLGLLHILRRSGRSRADALRSIYTSHATFCGRADPTCITD
eukprot:5398550-Pleurochrysis_carterae.AAC.2